MSEADGNKSRNRKFRKAIRALETAMTKFEVANGPVDWTNARHFLEVGEYELAVESVEWAVLKQDLVSSKSAEDLLNDAKRHLCLFNTSKPAIYREPNSDEMPGLGLPCIGENL